MNRFNIALWVSCLALLALTASCGGQSIGSPIQDDLNAGSLTGPQSEDTVLDLNYRADEDAAEEATRGASYTPGLPVVIPAGLSWMSPLAYGWKGGTVTEGATAPYVKLINPPGLLPQPEAWIRYHIKENVAGRLQTIKISGGGTKLRINLYKWSSATWQNFGLVDLNNGPVTVVVPAEYVQNGSVYLKLREPYLGWSRIDSIQVNVF